jgi:hypothetical protein
VGDGKCGEERLSWMFSRVCVRVWVWMCDRIREWRRFFLPYGGYTKIVHFTRTGLHCMNEWRERKG